MILDTNALSAILDGDPDIATIAASPGPFWLPAIVIGEYWFGMLSSKKRRRLESYFRKLVGKCVVLKVDQSTGEIYAHIRFELKQKGHPLPDNDIWIAALARLHNLSLVSRDSHFDAVDGIKRISWWEANRSRSAPPPARPVRFLTNSARASTSASSSGEAKLSAGRRAMV